MVHIWAMYLLALFRETRAYPLIVKIFSAAGEMPFDLAGDVVTQSLSGILASVSGGDVGPLKALIENPSANEYVRGAAMDAMVYLWAYGRLKREEVMGYFLELFDKLVRTPGTIWDSLANACADMWPEEAMEKLRATYEDELIWDGSIGWDDVEKALSIGQEAASDRLRDYDHMINNLARQMGWMMRFQPDRYAGRHQKVLAQAEPPEWIPPMVVTQRRVEPKIGRNDPCLCGSGRKFKKCCGVS
jgi:hypothetical protein